MTLLKQALAASLLLTSVSNPSFAASTLDSIVAVVNKDIVLQSDLNEHLDLTKRKLRADGRSLPADEVIAKQILESLVLRRLQLQEAEKLGIKVSDEELNQSLAQSAQQNRMSLDQWRQAIESVGEDYQAIRNARREDISIARVRNRSLQDRVVVTDEEIDILLQNSAISQQNIELRLGHILIALPENPSAADALKAQEKANTIIEKARNGADFAELAQIYSDSPQALNGGDLGWRKHNELPTLFEDAVKTMNKGDVSDAIKNRSGLHIITLSDKRDSARVIIKESKVRHILIRPNDQISDSQAQEKLANIRASIVGGAEFAEMASANSDDPGSAARGGDLGYVTAEMLVPEFTKVMEAANIGDISEPFRSPFGWHILEVEDRRQSDKTEQLQREEARTAIQQRKFEEAVEIWRQKLLDEAYLEIRI